MSLRCAFAADYEGRSLKQYRRIDPYTTHITESPHVVLRTFQEMIERPPAFLKEAREWQSDRDMILKDTEGKRHLAEILIKVQRAMPSEQTNTFASFVFSVDHETAKRYFNEGQVLGSFSSPQDIQFHGIYVGIPREEKRVPLMKAVQNKKFADANIDPGIMKQFLEILETSLAECKDALSTIDHLGQELGIDRKKIETLKTTVQEFATYIKPEPTTNKQCFGEIGRCFTVPHTFSNFAREWHGLQIDTNFYERSYAGECTFFHEVNVFKGKIVIDWTARQYREFDKESYPFVYRVGDPRVRFGPLRNSKKK